MFVLFDLVKSCFCIIHFHRFLRIKQNSTVSKLYFIITDIHHIFHA